MPGRVKGRGVMMAAKTGAAAARERARAAKARLDAERAAHQQQIEDQLTGFYLAADTLETAQTAAAKARAGMAAAVETLTSGLKEPLSSVAVLCGITVSEVRALRKAAKHAAPPPPVGNAQAEPADQTPSEMLSEAPGPAANENSENAETRTPGDDNDEDDTAGLDQDGAPQVAAKAAS